MKGINEKRKDWKARGSLTVEACIVLPLFLYFFLLLLCIIKIACIQVALNHAVNETSKQIAATFYPVSFLNEYEEELTLVGTKKNTDSFSREKNSENFWVDLLSGEMHLSQANQLINMVKATVKGEQDWHKIFEQFYSDQYMIFKEKGACLAADKILKKNINQSILDREKLNISLVKVPESTTSYRGNRQKRCEIKEELGITLNRNDVLLLVEYPMKIPMPFWSSKQITLRSLAVERAWLRGSNGIYTEKEEGIDFDQIDKATTYVYRTKTGKKYHTYKNCKYLEKSCIPLTLEEAKKMGLTKHENCPNRF